MRATPRPSRRGDAGPTRRRAFAASRRFACAGRPHLKPDRKLHRKHSMPSKSVTIEDHFVSAGRSAIGCGIAGMWRVIQLFEGADGVAYARLVNAADQSLTKTVATGALLDRNLFRHAT